ncbi:MAG: amino acid permease [Parachlamydiales bacterium]|nr:amino acid permease [Parachlamydiales bacterium]
MLNVAMVMSLRGLPIIAKEGMTMFFYIFFSTVLFLIPVSLVSAELVTGWPEGGVYRWVKEAFGSRLGFVAIWLQWIQNIIWCSTVLTFIAATIAYMFFDQALATNKIFIVSVSLIIYWSAIFINSCGIKTASWITTLFVLSGTIFPGLLIIAFGLIWFFQGQPLAFVQDATSNLLPDFSNFESIAFLAGTILLFAGMEIAAVHAKNMNNPQKDYPRSVFISVLIILFVFSFGALSIGSIIPINDISLTAGIMQGFQELLTLFHIKWLLPVIGFLVCFGTIGGIIAWVGGPSKGLLATAKSGEIPPFFHYQNKNGVQTHILWIQGLIVTALAFVFVIIPDVNVAYFLLTSLTATLYLFMYLLMYAAALRLKYSKSEVFRSYQVPGGKLGMWIISGIGLLAVLFAIVVSYFPPSQLPVSDPMTYVWFMIIGSILFTVAPVCIQIFKQRSWIAK